MYKASAQTLLPTSIIGSLPRPSWHTVSLGRRTFLEAMVNARWREQYDSIPEDTRDFSLIRAKKALKKKMPTRNPNRQYWNEQQFQKLRYSQPGDLVSRGPLPWRLLAYMLQLSPEVDGLRKLVHKRLMDPKQLEAGERHLERMLISLHAGDFVKLTPEQVAAINLVVVNAVAVIGTVWAHMQVTPVAKPSLAEGTKVKLPDGTAAKVVKS